MSNYPIGADTSDAPWNQREHYEEEIEVLVSVTLSKTVKISVYDYKVEEDEEGRFLRKDFSDCNLKQAVEEQIHLPQEQFKDWNVDDYEVLIDE